jgi:outer membrane protein
MRTLLIKASISLTLFVLLHGPLLAQQRQAIDEYVEEGLRSNIVLQQKDIALERAMLSFKIANGMFAPTIGLQANYINGDGGRTISLPIGDLLNPVYATLNALTGSNQFPQIENVNQTFFPNNFYDARVRTTLPIVNSDLIYNRKIKSQQTILQEFEVVIYKRELVRNIKVAYLNYLAALEGVKIYQTSLIRAQEGKRVNESLLRNGKGLPAYVLRSESEIESLRAQLVEAERQAANAKMYFNFLLNRDSEAEINTAFDNTYLLAQVPQLLESELSIQKREELKQLQVAGDINQNIVRMNSLFWSPKISGFLDLGAQSENLLYNSQSNYYLFGFQLDVPLFAGNINRNKINQAKLDEKNTLLSTTYVKNQLNLATHQSYNSLVSAWQNYLSAQKQFEAAESYQKLIEKGYKEGVNTFIESIDARNQLTSAQLLVIINQYKLLISEANLERETASFELK